MQIKNRTRVRGRRPARVTWTSGTRQSGQLQRRQLTAAAAAAAAAAAVGVTLTITAPASVQTWVWVTDT